MSSPAAPAGTATLVRVRVLVSGRVQGVWYRGSTRERALELGLVGWVRNLPNGCVRLEAQGTAAAVERLLAWCQRGPSHARVDGVEVQWLEERGDEPTFVVLR